MLGLLPWAPVKQAALLSKTDIHLCDWWAELAKQNPDYNWNAASQLFQIYFTLEHLSTSAWMFLFEFSLLFFIVVSGIVSLRDFSKCLIFIM